ncbi:MAG: endonuclease III domain-containing protein [Desulfuromonadales bacterium]|nr:endonuclease III domain-containing protein [Desulfuromonadales bacterium]
MTLLLDDRFSAIFTRLNDYFGDLHWWPAESPFEVAIGAILTQNTAWRNVELAINNLRDHDLLTTSAISGMARDALEELIRPAGFFHQKAEYLHLFAHYLCAVHQGRIESLLAGELAAVRGQLLAFKGIGPETADSILLYAGKHPTFVVDAYTRRLFSRLGLLSGSERYGFIRTLFMAQLAEDVELYAAYHALIVEMCKQFCHKRTPDCAPCPLRTVCAASTVTLPLDRFK